jgi:hypothetical protein
MRICDLKNGEIKIGMRVKSLVDDKLGTINHIFAEDHYFTTIIWDDLDDDMCSGFFGNDCECEIIEPTINPNNEETK